MPVIYVAESNHVQLHASCDGMLSLCQIRIHLSVLVVRKHILLLQAKVEMFVSMQQLLQQPAHQSLVESAEKLVQLVLEHIGECNATSSEAQDCSLCLCCCCYFKGPNLTHHV